MSMQIMNNKNKGIILVLIGVLVIFSEHSTAWIISAILIGVGSGIFLWKEKNKHIDS